MAVMISMGSGYNSYQDIKCIGDIAGWTYPVKVGEDHKPYHYTFLSAEGAPQ